MPLQTLQLGMHWFPERQGGLDRVYYELFRALPAAGIGFRGLIVGTERADVESGGAVHAVADPKASLPQRWWNMRRAFHAAVETQAPDLIVSHFALYTAPVLDRLEDRPMAIHFQGPWADEGAVQGDAGFRHKVKRWVETLVYRRADVAVVLSNAFADMLHQNYNMPRDRIRVIPGGIDVNRFTVDMSRAQARARLNWPADRPVIVVVRRLVPRMGLENLIAAMEVVKQALPESLLMIAGRGMLQPQLASQIASLGLTDHVKLLGFVSDDDLPLIYRAADISVVPTVALEGFGLIAAESLASGTPCLVSPVGGLPEVVSELSQNLVLPSPSPADIAVGLSAALLGQMVVPGEAACRDYAAKRFAWNIIAARVAETYRSVAA